MGLLSLFLLSYRYFSQTKTEKASHRIASARVASGKLMNEEIGRRAELWPHPVGAISKLTANARASHLASLSRLSLSLSLTHNLLEEIMKLW